MRVQGKTPQPGDKQVHQQHTKRDNSLRTSCLSVITAPSISEDPVLSSYLHTPAGTELPRAADIVCLVLRTPWCARTFPGTGAQIPDWFWLFPADSQAPFHCKKQIKESVRQQEMMALSTLCSTHRRGLQLHDALFWFPLSLHQIPPEKNKDSFVTASVAYNQLLVSQHKTSSGRCQRQEVSRWHFYKA